MVTFISQRQDVDGQIIITPNLRLQIHKLLWNKLNSADSLLKQSLKPDCHVGNHEKSQLFDRQKCKRTVSLSAGGVVWLLLWSSSHVLLFCLFLHRFVILRPSFRSSALQITTCWKRWESDSETRDTDLSISSAQWWWWWWVFHVRRTKTSNQTRPSSTHRPLSVYKGLLFRNKTVPTPLKQRLSTCCITLLLISGIWDVKLRVSCRI